MTKKTIYYKQYAMGNIAMRKVFTPEEKELIKRLYPTKSNGEIARIMGRTISSINNQGYVLKLKKSKEYLRKICKLSESGKENRFPKGHKPANKGKKWSEYMGEESKRKALKTCFSKGHKPKNHKPVGSLRILREGYIEIKVAEGLREWKLLHRVIWEQNHGAIPKGCNIQFKDKNPQNCNIENLYMISRRNQMKNENSSHVKYPKEIVRLIQIKGALSRQINKIKKTEKNEQ